MKPCQSLLLILLVIITSCVSSFKMHVIQVEMMKPPVLSNTGKIDTIALFSRDIIRLDTCTFQYYFRGRQEMDSAIHYLENYNTCLDALAEMLVREGSFAKVINCRDSMNESIRTTDTTLYSLLFDKLGADALVFLDRYKLNDFQYRKGDMGTSEITGDFSEFARSIWLSNIWGSLQWTVRIKGDTNRYEYLQMDDLYYGDALYPEFFGSREKHQQMIANTSIYFGKQFAEKLIPSWQQTERIYYTSRDSLMKKGAQYCISGEWLKAAEIYKRLIDNNNRNISCRAAFNMALVCEMSDKPDAAINWLKASEAACPANDKAHKDICKKYLQLLQERINEIKTLDMLSAKKAVNHTVR